MEILLEAVKLKKVFNRRVIFQNISFELRQHQTLLVTGRNGSGKSTLVKIVSDVLTPTEGRVAISMKNDLSPLRRSCIGLVSPYLQMYDEFTAVENLRFALAIRGAKPSDSVIDEMMKWVCLHDRRNDLVRTYSSGMKQRMKYAFALIHQPPILILDEPTANLDSEGIVMVREIMRRQREEGILIVATNDLTDIETYDLQIDLNVIN